ncbi:hypothetical protein ACFQZC_31255 [Streptacidiphilus monticola]
MAGTPGGQGEQPPARLREQSTDELLGERRKFDLQRTGREQLVPAEALLRAGPRGGGQGQPQRRGAVRQVGEEAALASSRCCRSSTASSSGASRERSASTAASARWTAKGSAWRGSSRAWPRARGSRFPGSGRSRSTRAA